MYGANKKTIAWVVLAAFFLHVIPVPLMAGKKKKQVKIDNLISKIDENVEDGIDVEDKENKKNLKKLKKLSGFQKYDPVDFHVYLSNGGKEQPKPPQSTGSGSGNGTSAGTNSGSGAGANSGGGSGSTNNSSANNNSGNENPSGGNSGNQNKASKGKKATPDGNGSIAKPQFYPMCLFVDKKAGKTPQDMDEEIKAMIKMSLACDVNLVVFPRWVDLSTMPQVSDPNKLIPSKTPGKKATPGSSRSDKINELASASCNIKEALGVPSASVSTCDSDPDVAAEMCSVTEPIPNSKPSKEKWDRKTAGCAAVHAANGGGTSEKDLDEINGLAGQGSEQLKVFGGQGAVPSIERLDACKAGTITHEAQGHSQFGKPNGKDHGNGIGNVEKDADGNILKPPPETPGDSDSWTPDIGCDTMRANSFPNDGRYRFDPKRNAYMPRDTNFVLDIPGGEKVFKKALGNAKGNKNQDMGTEAIGGERKSPAAIASLGGYPPTKDTIRTKPVGPSGAEGPHPELKNGGGTNDTPSDVTVSGGMGRSPIPQGKGDPLQSATNTTNSGKEDADTTQFFKNVGEGGGGSSSVAGTTTTKSSDGSGSAGTPGAAAGDVKVVTIGGRNSDATQSNSTEKGETAGLSSDSGTLANGEKSGFDWNNLNNGKNKKKLEAPLLNSIVNGRTGTAKSNVRDRLVPNIVRGIAAVPSNEYPTQRAVAPVPQRASTEQNGRGFQQSFSSSSDPGLSRNLRETKEPVGAGRIPGSGRASVGRESRLPQESAYGDSSVSVGD